FSRTGSGSGTFTRQDSGPGATLPSGSGTYGYSLQEDGSWRSGSVSQSETGSDRYSLLQGFLNVSSASNAVPGHLDFSPFGAPFTDPRPSFNWGRAKAGAVAGTFIPAVPGPQKTR